MRIDIRVGRHKGPKTVYPAEYDPVSHVAKYSIGWVTVDDAGGVLRFPGVYCAPIRRLATVRDWQGGYADVNLGNSDDVATLFATRQGQLVWPETGHETDVGKRFAGRWRK